MTVFQALPFLTTTQEKKNQHITPSSKLLPEMVDFYFENQATVMLQTISLLPLHRVKNQTRVGNL